MTKREQKKLAREKWASGKTIIGTALASLVRVEERAELESAEYEVTIGLVLTDLRWSIAPVLGKKWTDEAKKVLPNRTQKTVYRWENAGAVAQFLGEDLVAGQFVASLVPFYKGFSKFVGLNAEDRVTAEQLLRDSFAALVDSAGTGEDGERVPVKKTDAEKLALQLYGESNRSGGSVTEDEDDDDDDENDDDENEDGENDESDERRESAAGLIVVDPAAVESAIGPTDSLIRSLSSEHSVDRAIVASIAMGVLRFAEEYGVSTMLTVLGSGMVPALTENEDGPAAAADGTEK